MKAHEALIAATAGWVVGVAWGNGHGGWHPALPWVWPALLAAAIGWAVWGRDRRFPAGSAPRPTERPIGSVVGQGADLAAVRLRPTLRPLALCALFALAILAGWARVGAANRPAGAGTLLRLLEDRPVIGNLEIRGTICREPDVASSHSILLAVAVSEYRHGTGAWHRVDGERVRVSVISQKGSVP